MVGLSNDLAIFVHDLVVVRQSDFGLVLFLLFLSPCCFSSLLLERHSLVLLHHGLLHGSLLLGGLVLEHTTHAGDSFGLEGVLAFVLIFLGLSVLFLSLLLVSPVLLVLSVTLHPLVVDYMTDSN